MNPRSVFLTTAPIAKSMRSVIALLLLLLICDACAPVSTPQGRGRGAEPGGGRGGSARGASIATNRVERRTYLFEPTNERMEYAVYVSGAVRRDEPSPLVIVLHGLNQTATSFLPRIVNIMPNSRYILAAPNGYNSQGWYGANGANGIGQGRQTGYPPNLGELSEKDVLNVLAMMRQEFNVDSNRIYIMGNSMGGAGAIHLGLKHRHIWAAVGARAAAIRSWHHQPDELSAAGKLPMILVHGDADRAVPVAQSRTWAAKMKEFRMTYEYHELRGVGHGVDRRGVQLIFEFFDKHSKRVDSIQSRPTLKSSK